MTCTLKLTSLGGTDDPFESQNNLCVGGRIWGDSRIASITDTTEFATNDLDDVNGQQAPDVFYQVDNGSLAGGADLVIGYERKREPPTDERLKGWAALLVEKEIAAKLKEKDAAIAKAIDDFKKTTPPPNAAALKDKETELAAERATLKTQLEGNKTTRVNDEFAALKNRRVTAGVEPGRWAVYAGARGFYHHDKTWNLIGGPDIKSSVTQRDRGLALFLGGERQLGPKLGTLSLHGALYLLAQGTFNAVANDNQSEGVLINGTLNDELQGYQQVARINNATTSLGGGEAEVCYAPVAFGRMIDICAAVRQTNQGSLPAEYQLVGEVRPIKVDMGEETAATVGAALVF